MFGYVRPALSLLSEEEKARYQSAYCGLCHAMGRRHGFLARFTLNYDFTFLAILFGGGAEETECRRCPAHPFRKKRRCVCGKGMEAAADAAMILTRHKLKDDGKDKGWLRGLPARVLCALFTRPYRRARKAMPKMAEAVEQGMEKLAALEGENSPRLDRAADAFARMLMAAAPQCPEESRRRVLEQMLLHLGRWIYLADGWDDLEEDKAAGRYNPIAARFGDVTDEDREYLATTMTHSLRLAVSAANLADFGPWTALVENTLYHGLPTVQKAVLDGTWREIKKQTFSREIRK